MMSVIRAIGTSDLFFMFMGTRSRFHDEGRGAG